MVRLGTRHLMGTLIRVIRGYCWEGNWKTMPLVDHPTGNYRFLPGIAPYSCGVVSRPGFEIVHFTLHTPLPYRQGFGRTAQFLSAAGRPKAALCAIELRSPRPFSFPGFAEFN